MIFFIWLWNFCSRLSLVSEANMKPFYVFSICETCLMIIYHSVTYVAFFPQINNSSLSLSVSLSQEDGKVVDGSLLGDANGVEPGTGRQKESGKWQRPRFTRKALMRCCLVKWIIASTGPKEQGETEEWWKGHRRKAR